MANEELWSKVGEPGWATNDAHREVLNKALKAYAADQ